MKNVLKFLLVLPLVALFGMNLYAQEDTDIETDLDVEIDVEEVTMDVVNSRNEHRSHGQRGGDILSLVATYMLEAGDVTQEELDALKAEHEAIRSELSALREAGDEEALQARLIELREERSVRREALSEYIESHEDLAAVLAEQREQIQDRREIIQDRRSERHNERGN